MRLFREYVPAPDEFSVELQWASYGERREIEGQV
jgi:hypothetical protein